MGLNKQRGNMLLIGCHYPKNQQENRMNETYIKAAELIYHKAGKPLIELPGKKWVEHIDDNWIIAIHANEGETIEFEPEGTMGCSATFGILVIWFNGWLAGLLDPYGGTIAAGELANEDTFIEAIENSIKNLQLVETEGK